MPWLLLALALGGDPAEPLALRREAVQMGTWSRVQIAGLPASMASDLAVQAFDAIERIEGLLSTWRPGSEVSRLNRCPVGVDCGLPPDLAAILSDAYHAARLTGFAFHPAVGALTRAWGVHEQPGVPDAAALASARRAAAPDAVLLSAGADLACRQDEGAGLDVGGFGKGAALDEAAASLRSHGVERALLDLGGQLLAIGGPYPIALTHPLRREEVVAWVDLTDASISTSSNVEHHALHGRDRPGHLIDPVGGEAAVDFGSASVIAPRALLADALSTGLFVLGPEAGLARAAALPGVEAVFLETRADGSLAYRATAGLERRLRWAAAREGARPVAALPDSQR